VKQSHRPARRAWLAWGAVSLAVLALAASAAALFFGVKFPVPPQPDQPPDPIVAMGANFSNPLDIEGSSSAAAPALTFEDDTDTGLFRSAANTLNVAAGGTEYLEIDSSGVTFATTLDLDSALDIDTSGSIDLTSTEAAADAIHLDANGTVTTGIDVDVGSVSGMTIDGGLVDIGGATAGVADGDNDVAIAGVLEVDGELELDGALDADSTANFAGAVTLQSTLYPSFADETITDGETLTPTYTIYALDCASEVTMTLAASGTEGQLLILIGDDTGPININDTNVRTNDGNAQALGPYDVITWVYQDSEWIEISESDNE
jgi:hypothetical protein